MSLKLPYNFEWAHVFYSAATSDEYNDLDLAPNSFNVYSFHNTKSNINAKKYC